VPGEQLPQRGIVAARHRGDQLIVVHRFSIAFRQQQVHPRGKLRQHHDRFRFPAWNRHLQGPRRPRPQAAWPARLPCARKRRLRRFPELSVSAARYSQPQNPPDGAVRVDPDEGVSAGDAEQMLDLAHHLEVNLPGTKEAFRAGILNQDKTAIIAAATALLDPAEARAAEAMVLDRAGSLTPAQLRAAINRAVMQVLAAYLSAHSPLINGSALCAALAVTERD
jgi:hypothetical protein